MPPSARFRRCRPRRCPTCRGIIRTTPCRACSLVAMLANGPIPEAVQVDGDGPPIVLPTRPEPATVEKPQFTPERLQRIQDRLVTAWIASLRLASPDHPARQALRKSPSR